MTVNGYVRDIVWRQLIDTWPDVVSSPLALVPVGRISKLPITSVGADHGSSNIHEDLTLVPTATALHYATERFQVLPPVGSIFVAADPWFGERTISNTILEAEAIASLYDVAPFIVTREASAASAPLRSTAEVIRGISLASLVHLACHGEVDETSGPALLISEAIPLEAIIAQDWLDMFPGRPIVVLSACELASSVSSSIANESWGFPAGLIAAGARNVIAPIWPVPDSPDTIRFAVLLHEHMRVMSPPRALAHTMLESRQAGVPMAVWGSYCCFGV